MKLQVEKDHIIAAANRDYSRHSSPASLAAAIVSPLSEGDTWTAEEEAEPATKGENRASNYVCSAVRTRDKTG